MVGHRLPRPGLRPYLHQHVHDILVPGREQGLWHGRGERGPMDAVFQVVHHAGGCAQRALLCRVSLDLRPLHYGVRGRPGRLAVT